MCPAIPVLMAITQIITALPTEMHPRQALHTINYLLYTSNASYTGAWPIFLK
ncbi:hypothetical protein HMPREF1544_07146 [Mucor circinelloides 1006PhL]|uniref:Uncharacterized protein n=1 Tax=Mucor circinelloides f. circinelloides (strain 1006PhL) TaxID=1220926 RepID=S2K1M8_MUCC1|nr:hypothetical protein HMPREF1544_07146 [Mucor circinelloides 1006PhL]